MLHVAVERRVELAQSKLLFNEASRNGPIRCRRVLTLRQLPAAYGEPLVRRLEVGEPRQRREQPFPDVADLVLDLALLPPRRRSASD